MDVGDGVPARVAVGKESRSKGSATWFCPDCWHEIDPVLGQVGGTRAVRALIRLADRDGDPYASAEAVSALARIGGSEATAYVQKAAQHRSAVVRRAAQKATSA